MVSGFGLLHNALQRIKHVMTSQLMVTNVYVSLGFFFSASGAVSRKPRKLFGPEKPFLVHCVSKEKLYTPETYRLEKFPWLSRNGLL